MENIFNNLRILNYYFDYNNITHDLFYDLYSYLYVNLDDENINTFRQDLRNALTINANEKYI
jgi:antirestriction protein